MEDRFKKYIRHNFIGGHENDSKMFVPTDEQMHCEQQLAMLGDYAKLNFNLDIDSTGKVGGLSSGEVKPGFQGPAFLQNLPPELKRTGRDAFNTLKRSIPIGKVFGGKVFPPFTF